MLNPQISRREFLKLVSAGSLAFVLKDLRLDHALAQSTIKQGRVTFSGTPLYDAPTFRANQIHNFGADSIVDVIAIDENGEQGNPFNSAWYQVKDGYTYSGWVQPVETNYQKPVFNIPEKGQVGEITVPFTDTKRDPYVYADRGYRVFYGSTHWVKRVVVQRDEKSIWYEIYDFYLKESRYIAAHDMRLVPNDELTTLSPEVPDEEKHIVVDLSTQLVTAFEGEKLVFSQRCSSGVKGTDTPKGEFTTYHKGASVHMTNEGDAVEEETVYSLPGVPWCSFFTGAGNAFHGTWWHNDYGRPRSHGASTQSWLCEPAIRGSQIYLSLDQTQRPAGFGLCPSAGARHKSPGFLNYNFAKVQAFARSIEGEFLNPIFQFPSYLLKRQAIALTGKFRFYDPMGNLVMFSEQKMFRLREDIRVYSDESKSQEVLSIKARQILDFSAAYDVVDTALNQKVGVLRRKGLRSLLRDEWEVLDANDNLIGNLFEDSIGLALLRRFLLGSWLPQNYDLTVGATRVADLKQNFNLFRYELNLDFSMDISHQLDRRVGIAAGILLAAIEGKQNTE